MTRGDRNWSRVRYLAPRRLVGVELAGARVGNIESGSLAMAYTLKRRIENSRIKMMRIVLLDIDGTVYAARHDCGSIEAIMQQSPHIVVGCYSGKIDAGQLAADLESMRRAA